MMTLLGFIAGLIGGFAVYHFFFRLSPQEKKQADLLKEAQLKLKTYHHQVSVYLNHSAELMTKIEQNCDQLHDHILEGSVKLNLDSNKQSTLQPAVYRDPILSPDEDEKPLTASQPIIPPKDYA